ncbi:uncharacterized protein LOC115215747 isoform X1 [Argonauta hians]
MSWKKQTLTVRFYSISSLLFLICFQYFCRVDSISKFDESPDCGIGDACKTVIEYGEIMYRSQLDICKCPQSKYCPASNPVSRYIGMKTGEPSPIFTLYYCNSTYTKEMKTCQNGEVSVSFKGSKMLPSTVKNVYCRCPKQEPLHLAVVENLGFKKTESYSCSMPVCNTTDVQHICSQKKDTKSIRYLCHCPANHVCEKPLDNTSTAYQCQQQSHSV